MPRICELTGRKTSSGQTYTHRGKAKYLGGVGIKITGKTKRKFRPNIHSITALVDGSVRRIKVSAKAIRMGLVIKPLKRRYAYRPKDETQPDNVLLTEQEAASSAITPGAAEGHGEPQADAPLEHPADEQARAQTENDSTI